MQGPQGGEPAGQEQGRYHHDQTRIRGFDGRCQDEKNDKGQNGQDGGRQRIAYIRGIHHHVLGQEHHQQQDRPHAESKPPDRCFWQRVECNTDHQHGQGGE